MKKNRKKYLITAISDDYSFSQEFLETNLLTKEAKDSLEKRREEKMFSKYWDSFEITEEGVAIVSINSALVSDGWGGVSYSDISSICEQIEHNEKVTSVVFDFNSPGGMFSGALECAKTINDINKPKCAYVGESACSAAYLLAAACGEIYCHETATVGSIGVQAVYYDMTEMYKKTGINILNFRSSHASKKNLDPKSKEGKEQIQKSLDESEELFIGAIANYRGVTSEQVINNYGQGLTFGGAEALGKGMVDGLCESFDDCIDNLISRKFEGGKEEIMGENIVLQKATDEQLKAELESRPQLFTAIKTGISQQAISKERERAGKIQSLLAFGAFAQEPIQKALDEGKTFEEATSMVLAAKKEYDEGQTKAAEENKEKNLESLENSVKEAENQAVNIGGDEPKLNQNAITKTKFQEEASALAEMLKKEDK